MKELLALSSIIILANKCLSIRILVNNMTTSRTRFCEGDRVSVVCTIDDNIYQWNVDFPDNSKNSKLISVGQAAVKHGPFTFYAVINQYSGNTAYLEVVAYQGLDNSIACEGKEKNIGQSQSVDIRIAGESSRPQIAAEVTSNQKSVIITVTPGDVCVNDYRVTLVESGRKRISKHLRVINSEVVVKDIKELFPKLILNLCKYVYYFTLSSINEKYKTNAVKAKANYTGFGGIENFVIRQDNIQWTLPDNAVSNGCFNSYKYTLKMSGHSGTLPFRTSHSTNDIARFINSPCKADILSVVPISAATQQPILSSGASGAIILDEAFEKLPKIKSRTHGIHIDYQFGLESCPDTHIVTSIRDEQSILNEVLVPSSSKTFEFTNLTPNTTYTCSFEITNELLGIMFEDDMPCKTEEEPSSGTVTACGTSILVVFIAIVFTSFNNIL